MDSKKKSTLAQKKYRDSHKEEIKKYRDSHKDEARKYRNSHKEVAKVYAKNYYMNHKEKLKQYKKEYNNGRLKVDRNFKLSCYLRSRLRLAIKDCYKSGSAVRDLGCTIPELKIYLESKFKPGMTWDNWSRIGWHIDHIKPLYKFNMQDRGEFLKANHYTNLQPLWAEENLSKGRKS
jgi:hypothetical protein